MMTIRALHLRWRLYWARADIRHAQDDLDRLPKQLTHWRQQEAALVCELARLPRSDWPSIVLAAAIGAALACVLAWGP